MFACCVWLLILGFPILCLFWLIRQLRVANLSRRPVLITGCDHGIGYELALAFCDLDLPVFASCLTEEGQTRLKDAAQTLKGASHFWTLPLDVRKWQDFKDA